MKLEHYGFCVVFSRRARYSPIPKLAPFVNCLVKITPQTWKNFKTVFIKNNGDILGAMSINRFYSTDGNASHLSTVIEHFIYEDYDSFIAIGTSPIPKHVLNSSGQIVQPQVDYTAAFCSVLSRFSKSNGLTSKHEPLVQACIKYMQCESKSKGESILCS